MKKDKQGITMVSLVLYVALFFVFTVFATLLSTNLNHKILNEKGQIIIEEEYSKIYMNLLDSAKQSETFDIINTVITFSNGDIYEYSKERSTIFKNKGKLATNIKAFDIISAGSVAGNIDIATLETDKMLCLSVTLTKYASTLSKNIVVTVEGDING